MKKVIYRQEEHKKPLGGVKNNERCRISLYLHESVDCQSLDLVYFNDRSSDQLNRISMSLDEVSPSDSTQNSNYETELKSENTTFDKVDDYEGYKKYFADLSPLDTGLYFYYFQINYHDGSSQNISRINYEPEITDDLVCWQLTVYDADFSTPDWIKGGIIYQIFPDRFKRSDSYTAPRAVNEEERTRRNDWGGRPQSGLDTPNYSAKDFFMGNLDGIRESMSYLGTLNVDLLYLNPIVESSENHRYSTADYKNVDPYLGSIDSFKDLCQDLKKSGISVILDGVFSHTGSDSIYFNKYGRYPSLGAYQSRESSYYPWFNFIDYPNTYASWWGFDNLPELIKENEDYTNYICNQDDGVLKYWQDLGASGWRLDVADELPDVFIDRLRESIKASDPDALIIGEVWEDATNKFSYGGRRRYLLGDQLDSVMNYPWRTAIIDLLKGRNTQLFKNRIMDLVSNYPGPALDTLMNLLSSHDTARITNCLVLDVDNFRHEDKLDYKLPADLYQKAIELEKIASFIQFTLPGIPSLYYGDENGMEGFSDPFNRCCFVENDRNEDIYDHYKALTGFRSKYRESFKSGFKFSLARENLICYYRNDIACLINLDDRPALVEEIIGGEKIFGNKETYPTEYGLVVGPNSFTAIKIK
nr:glycoside hydrolase family 13 protein [uncultured Peptostreptococcus sp.]